jgi:hypothetical protein
MLTYHFAVQSDTKVEDLGFMGLDGDNAAAAFGEQIIRELLIEDPGKYTGWSMEIVEGERFVATIAFDLDAIKGGRRRA